MVTLVVFSETKKNEIFSSKFCKNALDKCATKSQVQKRAFRRNRATETLGSSRIRGGLITHSRWAHFVSSLVGFISYSRWAHYQFSLGQLIKYSRWAHYAAKLGPTQNCYKSLSMYGESGSQHWYLIAPKNIEYKFRCLKV